MEWDSGGLVWAVAFLSEGGDDHKQQTAHGEHEVHSTTRPPDAKENDE